jgi:hypothetical protein
MADLREYHPTLWDRIRQAFGPKAEEAAKFTPMGMAYDGGRNMAQGYLDGNPVRGAFGAAQTALPMLPGAGAFLGRAKPGSEAFDAAAARMLERQYPNEASVTGGGMGRLGTHLDEVKRGESLAESPFQATKYSADGLTGNKATVPVNEIGRPWRPHASGKEYSGGYEALPVTELSNDYRQFLSLPLRRKYDEALEAERRNAFGVIQGGKP